MLWAIQPASFIPRQQARILANAESTGHLLTGYSDIPRPIPKVSSRTSHIGPANIGPAGATLAYLTIYNRNPPDRVFRLYRLVITHYNF